MTIDWTFLINDVPYHQSVPQVRDLSQQEGKSNVTNVAVEICVGKHAVSEKLRGKPRVEQVQDPVLSKT